MRFLILLLLTLTSYSQTIGVSKEMTKSDEVVLNKIITAESKIKRVSMVEAMELIKKGEMDAYVGHVTINSEREVDFDFSAPYQQANLKVLFNDNISVFVLAGHLIKPLSIFICIIVGIGVVIWMAERGSEDQFTNDRQGLFNAVYFSAIISSTIGLGDKSPSTNLGKIVTVSMSLVAMIAFGVCFSTIVSVQEEAYEIPSSNYAVVRGSTGEVYVVKNKIKHTSYDTLSQAVLALHGDAVSGVLYDEPLLKPFEDKGLQIGKESFSTEYYGILLDNGSKLREQINRKLN